MEALEYIKFYVLQDKVLETIFSGETTLYLTGGTCLNRFYQNRRYSDDLDLFTNENAMFRDDIRIALESLKKFSLPFEFKVDTRDFVRLYINEILQVDFVNDRVYRHGKSIITPEGYAIDNIINMSANKICAIIGRDDPKDMFDLYTIYIKEEIDWKTVIEAASKKCVIDPETVEYRLSTFPLELLDLLKVVDPELINDMKNNYTGMVKHITDLMP
ncbi:MAG: nucleotidyl transferase AbiEii/AbiGii toxin family protein [Deltaproteobacteria bacterium]|nr:nucleotidyl transferase AbiEii/AbiGii toxin family protein [Deltaproteobacteria bacterium]